MQRKQRLNKQQNRCRLPDAINMSTSIDYTQVPNILLRNPIISGKAKAIQCLLLSNREGWTSYLTTLKRMMKEGEDALRSGLKELEQTNYLIRIRYRDKKTKVRVGSFWAYTDQPGYFRLEETLDLLDNNGLEPLPQDIDFQENPDMENPDVDNPKMENPRLKILSNKKTKENKSKYISPADKSLENDTSQNKEPPSIPSKNGKKPPAKERSKKYLPTAKLLAKIIQFNKNIAFTPNQITMWSNEIRKLVESHKVEHNRVRKALKW